MFTTFEENVPDAVQVVDVKIYPSCHYQQEQDERFSSPASSLYLQ